MIKAPDIRIQISEEVNIDMIWWVSELY
jgi:hypothetical protein